MVITITPPVVVGDWARLDTVGRYTPQAIPYTWPSYGLQIGLWAGMMLSLWWAFRGNHSTSFIKPLRFPAMLLILILLGFGLRLYSLNRLPLLIDEIGFAARAADMLHGQHVPIFAPGHNGNPSVFSWLLSGVMSVFGQNIFAARLLSLLFGTLSIPAAYALGRSWWSHRVGLVAAAFLATYPAHVHFSRLALYNIIDPFFMLLALALLARALRRGYLADFAWVGIWAGIAQYFYHGSRLLPVLIGVYLLLFTRRSKRQVQQQPLRVSVPLSLCVMLFVFVIVTLPRFAPMFTANLPLTGNLEGVRLPSDLAANALRSVLAWVGQPDVSPFWLGSVPLLPVLALLAAGVGLVIALRYLRDPRHAVLLTALLLTTMFGGVIWPAAPLYVRYMTALPAIVLLVALPFESILNRRDAEKHREIGVQEPRFYKQMRQLAILLITLITAQGIIVSIQHTREAYEHVPAGLWEADTLARAASHLPEGVEARLKVSDDFGEVERVTIADYIAFYGQRRPVSIIK